MESDTPGNPKDPPISTVRHLNQPSESPARGDSTDFVIPSQQPSTARDETLGVVHSSLDDDCLSYTPKPSIIQQSASGPEPKLPLAEKAHPRSNSSLNTIHHIPLSVQTQSNATPVSSDVVHTTLTSVANVASGAKRVNVPTMPRVPRSETTIQFTNENPPTLDYNPQFQNASTFPISEFTIEEVATKTVPSSPKMYKTNILH
ncbi:MAG: hypothetical protein EZS28_044682 [Streblomastix strix]|uniref:Uncharacterized protein n=1 Tax=Streblomastix strix TaxID=222440 RepID=A0A5J4TQT2_9EUKA|nr:MAG: hypothetical protein EZS28_044682 [Streblomastix strix]